MLVQSFNIRERTLHFAPGLTRKDFDDLNAPGKSARELTETVAKVITADEKPAPRTASAREKQRADEVQYAQWVTANVSVAPIHSGLDGGMNRVFLAQVGGSIPPARVPPSGSRPLQPPDNNGSLASKLFGLFGWKPASQTQVASADSATQERGADSATTGSTATPKAKLASQIETFTAANSTPSEQPKIESTKNDAPLNNDTNSQPQQTGTVQLQPALRQEANARATDNARRILR